MNEKTPFGLITAIKTPFAIKAAGSCQSKEGILLANYIFENPDEPTVSKLVYTLVDANGELKNTEGKQGILPTLFVSPKDENYVSLQSEGGYPHIFSVFDPSEQKSVLPCENLCNGRFVGVTNTHSVFFEVDIWNEKKEDVLFAVDFQNNLANKEHSVHIPFPKGNKINVADGEIHLIAEVEEGWLHRQIDECGKELKRRVLDFDLPFVHEVLSLSFTKNSYLLTEENGEIGIVEIDAEGNCMYAELYNIGDEFFGTWHPKHVNDNTCAVQFTTEFGNGWLVVKKDELVELFYNKNKQGYKNLLTGETLTIANNDLVLANINAIGKDKFGIVFYPRKHRKEHYDTVYVLQRHI